MADIIRSGEVKSVYEILSRYHRLYIDFAYEKLSDVDRMILLKRYTNGLSIPRIDEITLMSMRDVSLSEVQKLAKEGY